MVIDSMIGIAQLALHYILDNIATLIFSLQKRRIFDNIMKVDFQKLSIW